MNRPFALISTLLLLTTTEVLLSQLSSATRMLWLLTSKLFVSLPMKFILILIWEIHYAASSATRMLWLLTTKLFVLILMMLALIQQKVMLYAASSATKKL